MAFSITERVGSLTSLFTVKGGLRADIGMITSGYSSLGVVNSDLDDYAFAEVGITTDLRYYRNQAADAWILYFSSSNFSTGNLSPLFTTSIVNPTTAPALTFALSTAGVGTVFGNPFGVAFAPSFTSVPALGATGVTAGGLIFRSATVGSGEITVQLVGASGNYNFNLPLSVGSAGQVLTSQGGVTTAMTWTTLTTGTVTSFSAGNLSPLFTTSVATATSTPALTFIISNAAIGTVYGNPFGVASAPSFITNPTLGETGATGGSLIFRSATGGSGEATIRLVGSSGNYNFNLPLAAGTAGQVLTSGGGVAAAMTWSTVLTGVTADNGLTMSAATNVQLGGTLLHDTTIAGGSFTLELTSTGAIVQTLYVSASGSGTAAIRAQSAGGVVSAQSTGASTVYTGISAGGLGANLLTTAAATNTVLPVLQVSRATTGTAAAGIGVAIDMYIQNAVDSALWNTTRLISTFTTPGSGRTASFSIVNLSNNSLVERLVLAGSGALRLNAYGTGTFTGTAAYALQVDASGNIIEGTPATGGDIAGTYTPTLTNAANVTNSTAYECQYLAVTDGTTGLQVVTVSGKFAITFTTGGTVTRLGISIPIVSSLGADQNVGGVAASNSLTNGSFAVRADTTNNRAEFYATAPGSGTAETYWFTFTYVVNPG